jgi:hypothetical protein
MAITNKTKNKCKAAHQKLMTEWLEALRSGKFKQGKHSLHTENSKGIQSFCCLGVLGKICADNGLIKQPKRVDNPVTGVNYYNYYSSDSSLDGKLFELSGMRDTLGEFKEDIIADAYSLAELNDGSGYRKRKTFKQIAKIIEKELKNNEHGLFRDDFVANS